MSKQFVAVNSKDLVVGKEYYDIPYENGNYTVLRFLGNDEEGDPMFENVSGDEVYPKYPRDEKGRYRFFSMTTFYEEAQEAC